MLEPRIQQHFFESADQLYQVAEPMATAIADVGRDLAEVVATFDVGMYQLGGHAITLSNTEIGLGTRERVSDVAPEAIDRSSVTSIPGSPGDARFYRVITPRLP